MSSLFLSLRRLPRLITAGTGVVLLGALGDFSFHLSGGTVATSLVGQDGYRAHLVTFAGMVISVLGLISHALHQPPHQGEAKCPTVHS